MSEPKKISFGFSKIIKKPDLINSNVKRENIELIDCIESKTIKVVRNECEHKKEPLIIPMKQNKKLLTNLIDIIKEESNPINNSLGQKDFKESSNLINAIKEESNQINNSLVQKELNENSGSSKMGKCSLDMLAANEIIKDLNKAQTSEVKIFQVPLPNETTTQSVNESTLDDYDNIPIADFGLAMLRGMGWKEGKGIGESNEQIKVRVPELRPKGLGLGADRPTSKSTNKSATNNTNPEDLQIKKGAFVKVVMGKHVDCYGQIEGLDDSGRLFIKMALGGSRISLNGFMVEPISKAEYERNGRVLNSKKYDAYKKQEHSTYENSDVHKTQIKIEEKTIVKREKTHERELGIKNYQIKEKEKHDKYRTSTYDASDKKKYDSYNKKKHKTSHKKSRNRRYSSEDSSDYVKRSKDRKFSSRK